MRWFALALWLLSWTGAAVAQNPDTCSIPGYLLIADDELLQVRAAVRAGALSIVVVGSGSTMLAGPDGPASAYPARLKAALAKRLPGIAVAVTTVAKSRETAEAMARGFGAMVGSEKPNLVIWQTGTVDAIRGVSPDEFRDVLEAGVASLRAGGADVMLVNMQYSPRTESLIAVGPFVDTMRIVAQQSGVILFDRLGIMRYWSEVGQFDLHTPSRSNILAKRVHDCLGRAIASLIIEAAHLQKLGAKTTQ